MSRLRERTGPLRRAWARHRAQPNDRGATLLMALVFITVVAVVVGAILSFVDSSMRATVAVRAQAAQAAAADGAAQLALNDMRQSTYGMADGSDCFKNGTDTKTLTSFYTTTAGAA